ncbi:MAG TPA: hypothetical protein PLI43_19030 [Albidovulum sp.]|uniref:hypothetical protein n=1 Tax=Albidovulum sp. TaxID=1872424 RepID=UPI002D0B2946|nr:hypothetical protein [Albidovulum sp.]
MTALDLTAPPSPEDRAALEAWLAREAMADWCASSANAMAAYCALPKGPKSHEDLADLSARFPDHIALEWGPGDKVMVTLTV